MEKFLLIILVKHFNFFIKAIVDVFQLLDDFFLNGLLILTLFFLIFVFLVVLEFGLILRRVLADKIGQLMFVVQLSLGTTSRAFAGNDLFFDKHLDFRVSTIGTYNIAVDESR